MAFDLISYIVGKSDSAGAQPSGNLDIIENGEYDVKEYATATVNVQGGGNNTIPFSNIFDFIEDKTEVKQNV